MLLNPPTGASVSLVPFKHKLVSFKSWVGNINLEILINSILSVLLWCIGLICLSGVNRRILFWIAGGTVIEQRT
jgi:hypothetical protein